MRLIVRIEWGPMRGRKALLLPGKALRVGRLERADLVVPHDTDLSGIHFELAWDGARCTMRDLGSVHGTLLNGKHAEFGEIGHGEWIQAGETFFSIYVEGLVPPRSAPERRHPHDARQTPLVAERRKAEALSALRAEQAPLYAVLDAARDEWILQLLNATPDEVQSLYEGGQGELLAEVAPYLVTLPEGSWMLERLVQEGWGQGWGIFLICRRPLKEVRRQLRRLLIIKEKETETPFYCRFYDPKVLPAVLDVCNERQRQQMFGDIEAFLVESEDGRPLRLSQHATQILY